jgi:radical SAM superfamily enzyme YgiQ (UPF0313 family)
MHNDVRVLITTAYKNQACDAYDNHGPTSRTIDSAVRLSRPLPLYTGVRFIKQNVPQIEILESPTWEEYRRALRRGWDVVGFSFYTYETNDVLQMADYARKCGVREIWAGNYGALNPFIRSSFDKVFIGPSETTIARQLGAEVRDIIHPPLIDAIGVKPFSPGIVLVGVLYTVIGCPMKCTFCQASAFLKARVRIPIDSIDRVLRYYREVGANLVVIYDETFGIDPDYARHVVKLFRRYGILWCVLTRSDILANNFDEWYESGMVGASVGIESLNPAILQSACKQETLEDTLNTLERLHRSNCFIIGFYMVGFEQDTAESIQRDFRELARLKPDYTPITVATPFPQTAYWDELDHKYGIDCSDWSKFDNQHLVWKHPRLTAEQIRGLVEDGYDLLNSGSYFGRFAKKFTHRLNEIRGPAQTYSYLLAGAYNWLHGYTAETINNQRYFF